MAKFSALLAAALVSLAFTRTQGADCSNLDGTVKLTSPTDDNCTCGTGFDSVCSPSVMDEYCHATEGECNWYKTCTSTVLASENCDCDGQTCYENGTCDTSASFGDRCSYPACTSTDGSKITTVGCACDSGGSTQHCSPNEKCDKTGSTPTCASGCKWKDDWFSANGTVIMVFLVITLAMLGLTSSVVCCGAMRAQRKIVGGIGLAVGALAPFIPLFVSKGACAAAVSEHCDDAMDQVTKDAVEDTCTGVATILTYMFYPPAWLLVGCGIATLCLGAGALCGCCKAKDPAVVVMQPQQAVVISQPVQAMPVVAAKA